MVYILDFLRSQFTPLPQHRPPTVAGGTYIVTGSNTGLGLECARQLASLGAARLILAVRSRQKGEAALATIRQQTHRPEVGDVWELDLASFDSVEAFARRMTTLGRIDALVANAAVAFNDYSLAEGFETSLTVNVLATMLLIARALPVMSKAARGTSIQPRIAAVTSSMAFTVDGPPVDVEGNIFDVLSTEEATVTLRRYQLSKQMLIYAIRQLASLVPVSESGVIINVLNPGLCNGTDILRGTAQVGRVWLGLLRMLLGRSMEEGSRTLLHGAVAGVETHGKYLSDCEVKDYEMPTWMRDEHGVRMQKRVWEDLVNALEAKGYRIDVPRVVAE